MYPPDHSTYVDPRLGESTPEGSARPGFFTGVATIVTKLLNVVKPTRAYFGQKDAVQCSVIRRVVSDLNMPQEIVVMPTVREEVRFSMSRWE